MVFALNPSFVSQCLITLLAVEIFALSQTCIKMQMTAVCILQIWCILVDCTPITPYFHM